MTDIFGMDLYIVLLRAETRVKYRKFRRSNVDNKQNIIKEEVMEWLQSEF